MSVQELFLVTITIFTTVIVNKINTNDTVVLLVIQQKRKNFPTFLEESVNFRKTAFLGLEIRLSFDDIRNVYAKRVEQLNKLQDEKPTESYPYPI